MTKLTPEHDSRQANDGLHPEVTAAYGYVDSVLSTADAQSPTGGFAWHGWALREAFLAGCTHRATRRPKPLSVKEQALAVLDDCADRLDAAHENVLRRALEALPND